MTLSRLRPLLRVALPVAVASVLVSLAFVNIVLVKTWRAELEDGVLWHQEGSNVVAVEVANGLAGARAGLRPRDVLLQIDGHEVRRPEQVHALLRQTPFGRPLQYVVQRSSAELPLAVTLTSAPEIQHGLYYSLALVGILTIAVGASVRLRRPTDLATLHFFWVTVAFFGTLSFTASGRYDRLDYFFDWADLVARLMLPPLFLHFALVFPERPNAWVRTTAGHALLPLIYAPAAVLAIIRVMALTGRVPVTQASNVLAQVEWFAYLYLSLSLAAGLVLMMRALRRLRSVTAQRQLRWIVWGAGVGAVPFIFVYVFPLLTGDVPPYAEYTAVLLGCVPLSFASALVRYRLMDIEVIIKKGLVVSAVVVVLAGIYAGTLKLVGLAIGANRDSSFWALLATLIVALVAPSLWNAIQTALDRLYYRDRYDYRRALVAFARDLNSDLDLDRLSRTLVARLRETFGIERIALLLESSVDTTDRLVPVSAGGIDLSAVGTIEAPSQLASRLRAGQPITIDDPVASRRLPPDETARWRETGLHYFIPCVSTEATIGVIALGHRPNGEPLNSEDMALLSAVAAQAATALENARLYDRLSGKAVEIERLRQFSDSVVESLTDGLVVVDMADRVLRWNRRMEMLVGVSSANAVGRDLNDLFHRSFVETLAGARRESASGTTLYRIPLDAASADDARRQLLVNIGIAPFETDTVAQAGWIIVFEDITERANLEEQLQLSEKMAAVGLLAAGVAHEVNTPLTGISSFTQMLLERADPSDPTRQLLEKIEQQTFRAAKIVNSLLNLSRPSGGEMAVIDLNAVIADVLALLEHQFRTHRIQVRKHLERPSVPVLGIEYKLQQVFLNLLLNARDAMPKGGWLSVTTAVSGSEALVEVADTGAGIPTEHLSRIYDPFFTTKGEGRGTGLGLSVSYGIVKEHGGTLTCESDVNQGTCFRLVLPVADRAARDEAGAAR